MAAIRRIYVVTTSSGNRLVEAQNKSQAINYVARNIIMAEVAGQRDLIGLVSAGIKVESAGKTEFDLVE